MVYVGFMQTFYLIFILTVESIIPPPVLQCVQGAQKCNEIAREFAWSVGVRRSQVPIVLEIRRRTIEACWAAGKELSMSLRVSDSQHYRAYCLVK